MTGLSVLTIVRNREAHLRQLIEGLRRSERQPDELIVVDMSDAPVGIGPMSFPVSVDRFPTDALPLAAARNRAAARARHGRLIFLDVDCIPMAACLGRMVDEMDRHDGLFCADIRYLGPTDARRDWREAELIARARAHPARHFPTAGIREEHNPGLFWSLAFSVTRGRFDALGGFDEAFSGYGAEDTDFGFRAAEARLPLFFVGGAIACHQHHPSYDPPLQHFADIVRNSRLFHARWGRWPMEGWLRGFDELGLIRWDADGLVEVRSPSSAEIAAAEVETV